MTTSGSIFPTSAGNTEPLARRARFEFGADGEDRDEHGEDHQHHGHEARREVIAVIDVGIE